MTERAVGVTREDRTLTDRVTSCHADHYTMATIAQGERLELSQRRVRAGPSTPENP